MKNLALVFTAVFLIGATVSAKTTTALEDNSTANFINRSYGNSFIFNEGGIEFSVFPDGQFDFYAPNYGPDVNVAINTPNVSFSFNRGYDYSPYIQYDDFGAIIQIENTPIYYDFYGRVTQVGNVDINYNTFGRVARVGGLYVHYNRHRSFTHYTGFINVYNQVYVYRPWHAYYAIPAPNFCIVYARPYRQFYTPVRYHYYRPYANNYRQPVHYDYGRVASNSNGPRGNILATNNRASDRYRQEATTTRNASTIGRATTSGTQTFDSRSRATDINENTVRPSAQTRVNQNVRSSNTNNFTRSSTPTREVQTQRAMSSDRNVRNTVQQNATPTRSTQVTQRQAPQRQQMDRNSSAVTKSVERVNNLPNRKPSSANTRISNTRQQYKVTPQRSSSQRTEQANRQSNARSASKRGSL